MMTSKATSAISEVVLVYIKSASASIPIGFHYLQINGTTSTVAFQTRITISRANLECAALHVESVYTAYALMYSTTSNEYTMYQLQFQ